MGRKHPADPFQPAHSTRYNVSSSAVGQGMRRREFLTGFAGASAVPLFARAQQRLPVIGFLGASNAAIARAWVAAFEQRLGELGWHNGRTVTIIYRWADGRVDRAAEIAAELVTQKVDVIVTYNTPVIAAAKRATSTIPIVFALGANPVVSGLVASLNRPGGNVTGLATAHADLIGKKIELLREADPRLKRLAIMANADNPGSLVELREAGEVARRLGLDVVPSEVRNGEEIGAAIAALGGKAEGLYVVADAMTNNERVRLGTLSVASRMSSMFGARDWVAAGGMMSYGPRFVDLFRRSGDYVDKILRGTKPQDLPVEQPTKFDLVLNLVTAKALGIAMPATLLARADEVIE
jgi:putative ABC transport system substrate-binding protein